MSFSGHQKNSCDREMCYYSGFYKGFHSGILRDKEMYYDSGFYKELHRVFY
jgi:hypothetical protein